MCLTTGVEVADTYYDEYAGLVTQPTSMIIRRADIQSSYYFVEWSMCFIKNTNLDNRERYICT